MVEVSRIVRKRAGAERDNFHRNRKQEDWISVQVQSMQRRRRWLFRKGSKCAMGGCGKMLEENADNFPVSKASKTGFSSYCKSCYDARFGKKDVPDGHQRCKGECGQVLKLSEKNFSRNKEKRSGFHSKCKSCKNAEDRAKRDAARGDKPKQKKRVRPQEDLPDGHQRCMGECSRVLEMSAENFSRQKKCRSGF